MIQPVRIAQIGTGHDHAEETMRTMRNLACFEIVGVAEPNPAYASCLDTSTAYTDIPRYTVEELLAMEDLEAVAIECEEEHATEYAQRFADQGVHVHLDKPGSHGYTSFEKLVETMRGKSLILHMGYMYRYNPMVQRALESVRKGELGDIYAVEVHMSTKLKAEKQEWLKKYKGGMMYYLGCHDIDLILQFMGGEPDAVIPLNAPSGQYFSDGEDYGFAVLKYKSGASFVKTCAAEYNGFCRRQLVICGTKGTIEIRPLEEFMGDHDLYGMQRVHGRITTEKQTVGKRGWMDASEAWEPATFHRYSAMMQAFAEEVRGLYENPYSYDYELALFRTVMKCCDAE